MIKVNYYKVQATDADVVLYIGMGEITYKNGSEDKVYFKANKIEEV